MSFITKNYENVVGDDVTKDFTLTQSTNLDNGAHKLVLTIRTIYANASKTNDSDSDVIATASNTQTASSSTSLTFPITLDFDGKTPGSYVYDVKWIKPSGASLVIQRGSYTILARVTVTDS